MELDSAVFRTGEATTAEAAAAQTEVPPIFLDHDIAGYLRGPEETVFALIDRKIFTNAVRKCRIIIIPPSAKLAELDGVGAITIDLIGAHVHEDGVGRVASDGFEQIESSTSIDVKVIERARGSQVVARLGCAVDQHRGTQLTHEIENLLAITDV